jgi:hypothetical protein
MMDLLELANSSGHRATLSNPLPRMNPLGLRRPHVRDAGAAAKNRRFPNPGAAIHAHCSTSTHDCGDVFGYAKFTENAPGIYARAMQQYEFLFIFPKGIRAAIEYRVQGVKPL